jgi:ubiquinone/menaquinone biosynthesis C-methylase UbiE
VLDKRKNKVGKASLMAKPQSDLHFWLMSLSFSIRDFISPRKNILKEVGIKEGFHVLDFGCGPGGYILPLHSLIGKSGRIFALDTSPFAIKSVKKIIIKNHLPNIETIHSDCKTGLPDNSIDVALLYDVYHDLNHPDNVLKELHRLLKPHGILSVADHHMEEEEIVSNLTNKRYFTLANKGQKTYSFSKSRSIH